MVEGRRTSQDSRESVYAKTKQLVNFFRDTFQNTNCPDLIQIQLGSPEASAEYQARGLNKQCENYIREITRAAMELLQEN
jgi:hypothetical protein